MSKLEITRDIVGHNFARLSRCNNAGGLAGLPSIVAPHKLGCGLQSDQQVGCRFSKAPNRLLLFEGAFCLPSFWLRWLIAIIPSRIQNAPEKTLSGAQNRAGKERSDRSAWRRTCNFPYHPAGRQSHVQFIIIYFKIFYPQPGLLWWRWVDVSGRIAESTGSNTKSKGTIMAYPPRSGYAM